jgi:DNA helicase-2/ATP-dependent DNA helicase PcrA
MPHPMPGRREHAPGIERLLSGLTAEQAQAVTHDTGPLLLLAGPGAGKTRTLTRRAAYLLATGRAAVGDPGRHVQRPGGGRAAPATG